MPKRATETAESSSRKRKTQAVIPTFLLDLKTKFEATNLFYAFCDARLTSSITLASIQKVIPDLTCQDLAAINVIIPNFVKFNVVSAETIEIEFGRPVSKRASKGKHSQALGNRGDEWSFGSKKEVVVKPDAIKKMIEQQNIIFEKAIPAYLKVCEEKVCVCFILFFYNYKQT